MESIFEINSIERYSEYKETNIEWAGKIPIDWTTLPIRAIFEERNERNDGPKTDFILSVTKDRGVIPYDEKGAVGNNKSEDIERYKLVYPNDFVINKMNVIIGSLGMSKYFGAFSQVYLVYKPRTNKINIKYYSYLFSNPTFYKSLIKYCTGIMELRESLNREEFKKINLPFPDFDTQTSIVSFLDRKTALIDQAIQIKMKQIELLKERKQILIQKAVTRGLNPNVKMKDSGVEWIGEIPEHWEMKRLSFLSYKIGDGLHGTPTYTDDTDFYFINGNNLANGKISLTTQTRTVSEKEFRLNDKKLNSNSILLSINGTIGNVARYCGEKIMLGKSAAYINLNSNVNPEFVQRFLESNVFKIYYELALSGTTINNLSLYSINKTPIIYPPTNEQKHIVDRIKEVEASLDTGIQSKANEIEILKEYKSTLINSAVTGKIKVS
jgi:type I restriction enzyme S subunit